MKPKRKSWRRSLPLRPDLVLAIADHDQATVKSGMEHRRGWPPQAPVAALVGVAAACGYSWWASGTRTFTWQAEILTALPLVAVAVGALLTDAGRTRRRDILVPTGVRGRHGPEPSDDRLHRPSVAAWAAIAAVVVLWELATYASSPRSAHPTLSSILDELTGGHFGKAVVFILWLGLGWYLVRI